MKECKCKCEEKEDLNPLNLKGGDVVEQTKGTDKGSLYLVVGFDSNNLRLYSLSYGNIWSHDSLIGNAFDGGFKKVNICFKRDC